MSEALYVAFKIGAVLLKTEYSKRSSADKLTRIEDCPGEEIRLQRVAKFWNQENRWDRPDGLFVVTSHRLAFLSKQKAVTATTDFLSFPLTAVSGVSERRIMHISPAVEFHVSGKPYIFTFFTDAAGVTQAIRQVLRSTAS
jgi:hypothetical protein